MARPIAAQSVTIERSSTVIFNLLRGREKIGLSAGSPSVQLLVRALEVHRRSRHRVVVPNAGNRPGIV